MAKRFMAIWFRYLTTDWMIRRRPALAKMPFVMAASDHGRMIVTAVTDPIIKEGVYIGMTVADARAIIPSLAVFNDEPEQPAKLLNGLAEWLIRYTPIVAIDLPDVLLLDITGCAHLWGDEKSYLTEISKRLKTFGYNTSISIAGTAGTAWAVSRLGKEKAIIQNGCETEALLSLPPSSLRLEGEVVLQLEKLGLRQISQFINMPRSALRRRFGPHLLKRLDQSLGLEEETIEPVIPPIQYRERLPCLEPIVTATGIEIALQRLLDILCNRLLQKEKGLRMALFKCYRVDRKIIEIEIGTNRPTCNSRHLFKLFEDKISTIEPSQGIELFILEAPKVEELSAVQEKLFGSNKSLAKRTISYTVRK